MGYLLPTDAVIRVRNATGLQPTLTKGFREARVLHVTNGVKNVQIAERRNASGFHEAEVNTLIRVANSWKQPGRA